MSRLKICTYPDPVLLKKAEPVTSISKEIERLAMDMGETMYDAPGIGLASPQVGISKRLIVFDLEPELPGDNLMVLINPEIIEREGEIIYNEGCLSIPGYTADVKRAAKVKVRGLDLKGKPIEIEGEGLLAVVMQHEIDHLDGKLFIDHINRLKRDLIKRRLKKMKNRNAK